MFQLKAFGECSIHGGTLQECAKNVTDMNQCLDLGPVVKDEKNPMTHSHGTIVYGVGKPTWFNHKRTTSLMDGMGFVSQDLRYDSNSS